MSRPDPRDRWTLADVVLLVLGITALGLTLFLIVASMAGGSIGP